jgi:glutaconate CoA-transferase subunit B
MTVSYTSNELMAVTASRRLQNGQNVVVGLGLPQVASLLAKSSHAPDLNIIYEVGVINPDPSDSDPGVGIADPRLWYRNDSFTGFIGTLGEILQKGMVDVGFLGTLQIDRYGNLNSTMVREKEGIRHFTGSGGAADIATFSKSVFVIMKHEKRKIIEKIDFMTSVGGYKGRRTRTEKGLPQTSGVTVFTNLCVMETGGETGQLELRSLHPGVSLEILKENTGFELIIPKDVPVTQEPTLEELTLLRERIDPNRMYIK